MKTNTLYCADNLGIMRGFEDKSIDLIYADPPFFTQRDWGDFDDRFDGMDDYIDFMKVRMYAMKRILKSTGSIYIQLDHHAVHYIKMAMDGVFGYNRFKTMITWRRCRPKGNSKSFANNGDYILFYTKGTKCVFNVRYGDYLQCTIDAYKYDAHDGKGRYMLGSTSAPSGYKYDLDLGEKMPERGYAWTEETMRRKISEGIIDIKVGNVPTQRMYWSNAKGVPYDNIWTDINSVINPIYSTGKPEALLERIIIASSNEGDLILDPFCGSGTTLVAAHTLGRNYIGIDKNPDAIAICNDRLAQNTLADQKV